MDEGQQSLQEAGVSDDAIVDTILSVTRAAGIYRRAHHTSRLGSQHSPCNTRERTGFRGIRRLSKNVEDPLISYSVRLRRERESITVINGTFHDWEKTSP
jgi:hypothetical protein